MSATNIPFSRPAIARLGVSGSDTALALNTSDGAGNYCLGHLQFRNFGKQLFPDAAGSTLSLLVSFWFQFDPVCPTAASNPDLLIAAGAAYDTPWGTMLYNEDNSYGRNVWYGELQPKSLRQEIIKWQLEPRYNGSNFQLAFCVNTSFGLAANEIVSDILQVNGGPYFVTLVFDEVYANDYDPSLQTVVSMYLNKNLQGSRTYTNGAPNNNKVLTPGSGTTLLLGPSLTDITGPMRGVVVDAVAVIESAQGFTAQNVSDLYDASALSGPFTYTPYADVVLADQPVGYWKLDTVSGDVLDSGPSAMHGTIVGTVTRGGPAIREGGKSFWFTGNGCASIPHNAKLSVGSDASWSVEYWAKPADGNPTWASTVSKLTNPGGGEGEYRNSWKADSSAIVADWEYPGGVNNYGWVWLRLPTNEVYHVVQVNDNGTSKLYVNGMLAASKTVQVTATKLGTRPLEIGGNQEYPNSYGFKGFISDVAIYDRALSSMDVVRHYLSGTTPALHTAPTMTYSQYIKSLTPLAYWRLKETSGTTFADEMGFAPLTAHGTPFALGQSSALFDSDGASVACTASSTYDCLDTGKVTGLVGGADGFSVAAHVKIASGAGGITALSWSNYNAPTNIPHCAMCHDRNVTDDLSFESWSWQTGSTRVYSPNVNDDKWHAVVMTYTKADNSMRLYIDGRLMDTKEQGTPPAFPSNASVTLFNNVYTGSNQSVNCSLSEVAVFNYPLTSVQVADAATLWLQTIQMNPDDKYSSVTLSNNNRTASNASGSWASVRATHGKRKGRWYWETVVVNPGAVGAGVGFLVGLASSYADVLTDYTGSRTDSIGLWPRSIGNAYQLYAGSTSPVLSGAPVASAAGTVYGHVYDCETGVYSVYADDTLVCSTVYPITDRSIYPTITVAGGAAITLRLAASEFTQAMPTGCTAYAEAAAVVATTPGWDLIGSTTNWRVSASAVSARYSGNSTWGTVRSTLPKSSDKRYFEVTVVYQQAIGGTCVGVVDAGHTLSACVGVEKTGWGFISNQYKYNNNALVGGFGATYTTGDVIGVLVDFSAKSIEFFKNGVSQGVAYTAMTMDFKELFPAASCYNLNGVVDLNMGHKAFAYALPSGAVAWNS